MINGENTSDGNAGASGFFPAITATDNGPNNGNVPIAEVSIDPTSKSGTAVWEVVNTNPNTPESFKFAVYISYTASVASELAAAGYFHRQPLLRSDGNVRRAFQHGEHSSVRG